MLKQSQQTNLNALSNFAELDSLQGIINGVNTDKLTNPDPQAQIKLDVRKPIDQLGQLGNLDFGTNLNFDLNATPNMQTHNLLNNYPQLQNIPGLNQDTSNFGKLN